MNKWIKVLESDYKALSIIEIKCPYCKHKETILRGVKPPRSCYVCERRLNYEMV